MGLVATSPLPSEGVPNASERGTKSDVAHKWRKTLIFFLGASRVWGKNLKMYGTQLTLFL